MFLQYRHTRYINNLYKYIFLTNCKHTKRHLDVKRTIWHLVGKSKYGGDETIIR